MSHKPPIGGVYNKPLASGLSNSRQSSHKKSKRNRHGEELHPLGIELEASNVILMDKENIPTEQERENRIRKFCEASITMHPPIKPKKKYTFGDIRLNVSINTKTKYRRLSSCEEQVSKMLKLDSNTFEEETMHTENFYLPNEETQQFYLKIKGNQSADHMNKSPSPKESASLNDNDEEPMDMGMDENLNSPVTLKLPVIDETKPYFENTEILKILPRYTQPLREFLSVIPLTNPIDDIQKQTMALEMRQHRFKNVVKRIDCMLNKMNFSYENKTAQHSLGPHTSEDQKENCPVMGTVTELPSVKRNLSFIEKYPKLIGTGLQSEYILGPNGTKISLAQYRKAPWTSSLAVTGYLLNILFTNKELATQTLSGKPSAAIDNRRESSREKFKLDPARIEDIIVCVVNKAGGMEKHIRETIIKKCSNKSRKYKQNKLRKEQKFKKKQEENSINMA